MDAPIITWHRRQCCRIKSPATAAFAATTRRHPNKRRVFTRRMEAPNRHLHLKSNSSPAWSYIPATSHAATLGRRPRYPNQPRGVEVLNIHRSEPASTPPTPLQLPQHCDSRNVHRRLRRPCRSRRDCRQFVNTVTRGWVGASNGRAPFRFHGAVVGFVGRCLSRTPNLTCSNKPLAEFFSGRSWPEIGPGINFSGVFEVFDFFFRRFALVASGTEIISRVSLKFQLFMETSRIHCHWSKLRKCVQLSR